MSLALFRRPPDPPAIEVIFDATTYQVRLNRKRQARRYTLRVHAATREVVLTIPLRGSLNDARLSPSATGPGSRRGCAGCRRPPPSSTARWCRCAAPRTESRTGRRRAEPYGWK
jgi:hypothetical protein